MTNIETAKAAIEAEIADQKDVVNHLNSRLAALEKALEEIKYIDCGIIKAVEYKPKFEGPKTKLPKQVKKVKAAKTKKEVGELPSTGGDFWLNLINKEPQLNRMILGKALVEIGCESTMKNIATLKNRMTPSLNALVKSGKIQDSGKGRERRFFK